jgi:hypothetical protein
VQFSDFNAVCPFEIGDKVKGISGAVFTITDIATIYYLKKQTVEFMYELDNFGLYESVEVSGKMS